MYFRTDRTESDLWSNSEGAFLSHGELNRIETNMASITAAYGVEFTAKEWGLPPGSQGVLSGEYRFCKSDSDRIIKGLTDVLTLVRSRREFLSSIEPPTTFDKATIYTMNNLERLMQELDSVYGEYYTDVWLGTNPNDEAYGKLYVPYVIAYQSNVDLDEHEDEHEDDIQNDIDGREKIWSAMHEPYEQGGYSHAPVYIGDIYAVPFYLFWEYRTPDIVWGTDAQLANCIDLETATLYACTQITAMGNETLTISDTVNNYTGEYTRYRLYFKID